MKRIIEEKLPSIKVYFHEEEPGCEVFAANSFEHFPERYLLDRYDEPLYFENIEKAAKCIADIVGHPIEPNIEAIDQTLDDYLAEPSTTTLGTAPTNSSRIGKNRLERFI